MRFSDWFLVFFGAVTVLVTAPAILHGVQIFGWDAMANGIWVPTGFGVVLILVGVFRHRWFGKRKTSN